MSDASAIVHTMPSKITSLRISAGASVLLATAALAFVAGAATATALLGHSTDATSPALTIPHALAPTGSDGVRDTSVPDASSVLNGKDTAVVEAAPTF